MRGCWTAGRRHVAAAALAALLTGALDARADAPDTALAQRLYDEAKEAMSKQQYAEACAKFAESNRLDPATGGTLLNLAVCHEKLGRIASAWAEYEEAASLARRFGRVDREQFARSHADALKPQVSTLAVAAPDLPDLRLTVDGVEIARLAWGAIPIDPGDHTIVATAPGKSPRVTHLTIAPRHELRSLTIPALEDTSAPSPAPPPSPPPAPSSSAAPSAPASASAAVPPAPSSTRPLGFTLGGAGIAAAGAGAVFGLLALSANSDSQRECAGGCTKQGADDSRRAVLYANVSNVGFGVGAALVAVGLYFVLSSPVGTPPQAASTGLSVGPSGVGAAW